MSRRTTISRPRPGRGLAATESADPADPSLGRGGKPDRPALASGGRGRGSGRRWASRSGWGCRRSSGGCWRRAASTPEAAADFLTRPCARCCPTRRCWPTWTRRPSGWPTAVRRGETVGGVRRLRRGWRVQRGADGGACCAALGCTVDAPCAGPACRGLWAERAGAAGAGGARRDADRLRRLRHGGGAMRWRRVRGLADVVVLDHHKAEGPPPPVLATVNPNRLDDRSGLRRAVRRGDRVPDRGGDCCGRCAGGGFFAARARAGPAGAARPGGAGDGVRRDAADRAEPRAGGAGAEGDGAARAAGHRGAAGRGAGHGDRPSAMTLRLRAGAADQRRPGGSARPIWGCGCCCARTRCEARALAGALDAVNRQRQEVEAAMLEAAMRRGGGAGDGRPCGAAGRAAPAGIPAWSASSPGGIKERFNRPACVGGAGRRRGEGFAAGRCPGSIWARR